MTKSKKKTKKVKPVGKIKSIKDPVFDGSCYDYLMRINGFSCGFNMPNALTGESTYGLPPYNKRMPFLIDEYPACPKEWMRSEGKVKSYFVPVVEGKGMWLDFNKNNNHSHHVAIVISIQGVNPITGLPCKDAQMEQYIEKCPKHKIKFGPDRYCKKCDYKWPKQNYICTTATPKGYLWLDGFRTVEGIVRQYILTAEKMRGVASNIIGKDRVYAIGVSFFLSKEKRPPRQNASFLRSKSSSYMSPDIDIFECDQSAHTTDYYNSSGEWDEPAVHYFSGNTTKGSDSLGGGGTGSICYASSLTPTSKSPSKKFISTRKASASPIRVRKLEVGAGANISQSIYDDPEKLDYWHDEPEGIICVNYCTEIEARKIIEAGKIDIEGHKEGFLKEIPVGN